MQTVIFGCGGHARSIINVLHDDEKNIQMLLVDKNAKRNETILGYEVERQYELKENDNYIIAIGNNAEREKMYNGLLEKHQGNCISVVSALAHIGMETKIGKGTFIASYAYIGPQAEIGNNVIINTGSVIEHEVNIGDNTHIAPHATICGRSVIGNSVFIGAGSTVIDKINICDNVTVGAGAVVIKDITEAGTYVGVPAIKIEQREVNKC